MVSHPWEPKLMRGAAGQLPLAEQYAIIAMAEGYNIPAELLAAIRLAENGKIPNAFGILSIASSDSYGEELRNAAATIFNNFERYETASGNKAMVRGRATEGYIHFLAHRYAPVGVANDPNGLNQNWFNNVSKFYFESLDA